MNRQVTSMRRAGRRAYRLQRRMAWTGLVTILAMLLSLFPQVAGLPVPTASAHNLQTRNVYTYFDPDTQALLDARIASPGWTPPTPLLQVGDEIGLVIKGVPRDGTTTGVGGYIDFYIPNGVTVIDAAYLRPGDAVADGITGFDRVPMKGQSPIAVGAGPIGAKAQTALINLTLGPNINGVTEKAVADGTGLMRGTIAGVYGDTGIFYSTDPDTAWNTWTITGGFDQNPVTNDNTITNNSGDVVVPLNKWDAEQLLAFGAKAPIVAIVDTPDQRGNAPWGMASGVAGPQSGYAWDFDWDYWRLNPGDPIRMKNASDQMGPWQRIRYGGSGISKDQAGSASTVLGFASIDGSNVGYPLSPSNPLPPTVSQTDTTSPKVIRWSVGQTTQYVPEYVWVKFRINQLTGGLIQADGCPYFNTGAFGGDAGGDDDGKDHLWRYYEPTQITLNGCVAVGKPADRPAVKPGDIFSYKIKFYNAGLVTLTSVIVKDTLPSGVAFISAVPAQNSGPNPLVWNVGTLLPGQKWEATVTVKATGTGPLENTVTVTSNQFPPQTYTEITPSGSIPILSQSKSVTPSTVAPGGTVQYTLRIDNIGSGPSGSPLSITEYLPDGFTFVSKDLVTLNGANVTATTTVNVANPNRPVFTVPGAINAGQSLVLKFTAQVANTATAGSYCNYYSTAAGSSPRQTTGFQACVTVAAGTIGDTVFRDWNGNGIQDPEDEGLPGVNVTLRAGACPGGAVVATTTTDANGKYLFTGLSSPATYCVDVTPPAGYTLTTPPEPRTVALALNETNLTADFGYKPGGTGAIGDKVFEDVDNNGVFGAGDFGIPDVTVWLYEDTNNDGVITPGVDALVATTQSDSNGDYLFSNLATGINYLVKVDKSDPEIQAYFNNKYDPDPVPYQLSTVEIKPSPNLTGSDLDNDFGFWRVAPASIGDQVFIDNNGNGVYDAGDTPLAGITVTLLRDGEPFATTSTGPDGTYLFDNLGPGNYTVLVDTTDPDLPAGVFATVTRYDVTLAANQTYLTADFPFVNGLTKTVDKAYATAGQTLNFTLKPFYPGDDLLENVRIIDPLPAGTTYVAGSANAGGTFGAYTPIPAQPGNDPGPPVLDTAMSVSTNFVNTGGSVNVTLNVKSSVAINNVSPTDFVVDGGTAACTGPVPASANVPAGGSGVNFSWACTLNSVGEHIFLAAAEDATATYAWPTASSASVLSAPDGGPNVVTWNLGSNTAGIGGEMIVSGEPRGVYGLRGGGTNQYSKYGTLSGLWTSKANTLAAIAKGGALTTDGAGTIYALRGGGTQAFYAYNIAAGSWSSRANTGVNVDEGGALVYLNGYVYALMGNGTAFRRYDPSNNTWAARAATPNNVKKGGALTTDGTYIYALRGDKQKTFWRYDPANDAGGWTTMAPVPANVGWGGALTRVGGYIYALRGDGQKSFYRYSIANNTWTAMASTPGNVADGGALATDGTYIYAFQGKTTAFWRYDVAANKWTTLAPVNFAGNVGQGGALVYAPGVNPQGYFTAMKAHPTLVSAGHTVKVELDLRANVVANNLTPSSLTITPTGGASASCGSPVLKSADDDIADINDPVIFEWTCSVTPGTSPGSLKFSANATSGSGGSGNAVAVYGSANATNPTNAIGAPDGNVAGLVATTGNYLTLDLGSVVPTGTVITLRLKYRLTGGSAVPVADVDGGTDGSTFSGLVTISGLTTSLANYTYTVSQAGGIRYLRIRARATAGSAGDQYVDVDAVSFTGAGVQFPTATSNSVLVSPVLTFQATVNAGAPPVIRNTGLLVETSGAFGTLPSNTTRTATAGSIGDRVWADLDADGVQDPGELGLAGVRVYVDSNNNGQWDAGEPFDITNASGLYRIYGLAAGTYTVRADPATYPAGYLPTTPTSLSVTLTTGQQYNDADFGLTPPGTGKIGDTIWLDADNDGVLDAGEAGLPNITVRLYLDKDNSGTVSPGDVLVLTDTTDANGNYLFEGLPAGNYLVVVDQSSTVVSPYDGNSYTLAAAMQPVFNDSPMSVSLGTGQSYLDADFGYNWTGSIGDYVWYDTDFDGVQDAGEPPIQGAFVMLYFDANGNGVIDQFNGDFQVAGVRTDANGLYLFANLPPGRYLVDVYEDSITTGGVRDVVPTTSNVVPVTLGPGQNFLAADFGYYEGARVEGNVFWDEDRNGLLDPQERTAPYLLPNVAVTIVCAGTDGILGTGDDFTATKDTDANGHFVFIVPPGLCTLSYNTADPDIPAGLGDATTPTSFTFTAVAGEDWNVSFDFGVDNTGRIGDTVWHDADGNGAQDPGEPGMANVTVLLYRDNNNNNLLDAGDTFLAADVTDANGKYLFEGLADGNYIVVVNAATLPTGFTQTYDNSGPLDGIGQADISGGNTILTVDFGYRYSPPGGASLYTIGGRVYNDLNNTGDDEGEPGFGSVDVTVVCDYGTFVVQTNANGDWFLAGVPQGSVCTVLDADETDLPRTDYAATEAPSTPITVNSNISGLDFGYHQRPGSISGTVCEGNGDGQCQLGEAGIANVPVTLTWFGPDNILGTADDQVFNTLTGPNGDYSFTNLQPGLYQIVQTNLPGYTSLADADGGHPDNISPVVLPLGGAVTGRDFEDAPPPRVEVTKVLTIPISGVAVVSDTITFTIRITNTGITALPTLTITDTYDASYLTLTSHSVVPDAQAPGVITWTNSLAPFLPLLPGRALTITVDFHADVSTYPGMTENRVRVTGEDVLGVPVEPRVASDDVQIIKPSIGVAKRVVSNTNNGDGTYDVTYSLVVENLGDVPLSNVQVTDDLDTTFGAGKHAVQSKSATGLTINPAYTGAPPNTNLLAGTDTLNAGASGTITLVVRVTPGSNLGPYDNQAIATGVAPGNIVVTDLSDDGTDPDPDGDNNANEPGENDPTPVSFTENPVIGVAKRVVGVINNGNGTYDVTYEILVQNVGDVVLKNVQVTDNLATTFSAATSWTVLSTSSSTFTVNPGYNGGKLPTPNINLLAGTDNLAALAQGTITVVVRVMPGANLGPYNNSATGTGVSPAGTQVSDISQDGVDTDPDTPGTQPGDNPAPGDDSAPTPVTFTENPVIGVAKAVQSVDNLGGGQFRVTYLITVRNYGDVALYNVQITDNLATTFAGAWSWSVDAVSSADFSVNPAYTGTPPNTNLLLGTDTLAVGAAGTITLKVLVTPGANLGPYNNTAVASGDSPSGVPVSDVSQNGTNPDPDNNGDPRDNNVPTPLIFTAKIQIGVAKAVTAVVNNGDGTYDVTYSILVVNMGDTLLNNVQVTDNLDTTFGAGKHAVQSKSATGLTINPAYTGAPPNTNLLAGTDALNPGASGTITLVVRVTPGTNLGPYNNTARGTATGPGGVPTADNSQNGTNPDPDGDGNPTNNNQPTPVSFSEAPAIGVAKAVASVTNNGDGSFTVAYTITVRNYGDVVLNNVQVTDNLAATFPAPTTFNVVSVTSTGFTVNPGYNGSSDINLLTATGNTLAVGQTKTIVLTVRVTPAASPATYNNQATARGVSPAGAQVSDVSQVGVNPDPDGDGNPGNNGEPTPVTLTQAPGIAVVKTGPAASYVGGSVVYTYTVTNTGDVRLGTVTVTDNKCSPVTYVSGDANSNGYLDVNETWLFTCSYIVQAGDPDPLVNIATARGVSPLGQQVSATDDWTTDLVTFSIGDRVWLDTNGDGSQDPGETTGFFNVPIVITGTDVDGGTVNITVYTDLNGNYLAPLAKPGTYTVTAPAGFGGYAPSTPTLQTVVLTVATPTYLNADFGYVMPTGLYIIGPEAAVVDNHVRVTWRATLPEGMEAPAFHVWRSVSGGAWQRLTAERVPAGSFDGVIYEYAHTDTTAQRGVAYLYRIEAPDGATYGPCQVTVPGNPRVFLPLVLR